MPILKLKDVELYYDEFGSGDRFLIQAQQFVSKHLNYVKDLSEKEGFHGFIIRIRGVCAIHPGDGRFGRPMV